MANMPEQPEPSGREKSVKPSSESAGSVPNGGMYALVGIGFEFAITICVVAAIGWYLDRRLNTFPWLLVAGAAVGFAAGLIRMIRAGHRAFKD